MKQTRRPSTIQCPSGDGVLSLVRCGVDAHQAGRRGNAQYIAEAQAMGVEPCTGRVYVHLDGPETCLYDNLN